MRLVVRANNPFVKVYCAKCLEMAGEQGIMSLNQFKTGFVDVKTLDAISRGYSMSTIKRFGKLIYLVLIISHVLASMALAHLACGRLLS